MGLGAPGPVGGLGEFPGVTDTTVDDKDGHGVGGSLEPTRVRRPGSSFEPVLPVLIGVDVRKERRGSRSEKIFGVRYWRR